MDNIIVQLFFFAVIVPSAILHEYMHGWVANQLGDPTAKYAGRLTLDPRVHIDPIGSILLPLVMFLASGGRFLFAYAKPVPYNPYNLRNQKWGPTLVAFAGPLSNFVLAMVFGLFMQIGGFSPLMTELLGVIVYANVLLGVFNLVPIPPLDGSKLLYAILPDSMTNLKIVLERYSLILFLVFVLFFSHIIQPFISFFYSLFTGGMWFL
ncbi:MAG TPA: site-2 protease family protein [Candidatus Kapabacteria bacterium]|nr:site-2 protease family protein [Candidatus Kapabacteria bacterium]